MAAALPSGMLSALLSHYKQTNSTAQEILTQGMEPELAPRLTVIARQEHNAVNRIRGGASLGDGGHTFVPLRLGKWQTTHWAVVSATGGYTEH
jgi:hypothetical protein